MLTDAVGSSRTARVRGIRCCSPRKPGSSSTGATRRATMVKKSNTMSKGAGSEAADENEVFILTPQVEKPAELDRQSEEQAAEDGPAPTPKAPWRMWLRTHWRAVAIGGIGGAVTGALATWVVCRRRQEH